MGAAFRFEQDVKWLQTITTMPILVKGVVTAEDSKHLSLVFEYLWLFLQARLFMEC